MYGKLLLIQEQVLVLKSNRTQSRKHHRSQVPRRGLVKKRGILNLHNREGFLIFTARPRGPTKEMEMVLYHDGRILRRWVAKGTRRKDYMIEETNCARQWADKFFSNFCCFCVRYLNLAHLKNPKENLNQRLRWKWNMMHRWKARLGSCPHCL